MKDIIKEEFIKRGGSPQLFDDTWCYDCDGLTNWYVLATCHGEHDLLDVSETLGIPFHRVRYKYYTCKKIGLLELKARKEYDFLKETLEDKYGDVDETLFLCMFNTMKKLAVRVLLESGVTDLYLIGTYLDVSYSFVYRVKKHFNL